MKGNTESKKAGERMLTGFFYGESEAGGDVSPLSTLYCTRKTNTSGE